MKRRLPTLVIDDEPQIRGFLREILQTENWEIFEAASAAEAFQKLNEKKWALVFCDVMLGDADGYRVLRRFVEAQPQAKFVLMTGYESAAGAFEATSIGAYEYLVKPFSIDDVISLSNSVREQAEENRKSKTNKPEAEKSVYVPSIDLIGRSPKFVECLKMVGRVAPTNLPVLITGESGTGKELVARAIHNRSRRAAKNFVAVNCGAIPVELIESELFGHVRGSFTGADRERIGLWEEADGGTIFLDEITETTPQFQVKILRALQQSEIRRVGSNQTIKTDARVIAATNRDIEKEARTGNFREDLMYRLNAVTINLPSLRERVEDIPVLIEHFAARVNLPHGEQPVRFSPEAMRILKKYNWQGNVRELENAVMHAASMSDRIAYPEHLPARIVKSVEEHSGKNIESFFPLQNENSNKTPEWITLEKFQLQYVRRVLQHTKGNKQAAARLLDIDRKTLSRMVKRMNDDD